METSSIVYGKTQNTGYGLIKPLCSAIVSREALEHALLFIRGSPSLTHFNKLAHAYRIENQDAFFVTTGEDREAQLQEGFNEDLLIVGVGQKLLHLLRKFNVRNVMVVVLIGQKNPIANFEADTYRAIVKASKQLIGQLYEKLMKTSGPGRLASQKQHQHKLFELPPAQSKPEPQTVSNRIEVPDFAKKERVGKPALAQLTSQRYNRQALREVERELKQLLSKISSEEAVQFKFKVEYDESIQANVLFSLLADCLNLKNKFQLADLDLKQALEGLATAGLGSRLRPVRQKLLVDTRIRGLKSEPGVLGTVLKAIETLVRRDVLKKQPKAG